MAEISGPEKYAPPDQRMAEAVKTAERVTPLPWLRGGLDTANEFPAEKLAEIIQRAASASTSEIDLVVRMLDSVRDRIRKEGERVSGEIASYVSLSRSATMSMKVISDNLKQWQDMPK
jgi:hypothetical protein